MVNKLELDPCCEYILEKSYELLKNNEKFTIEDLHELMGCYKQRTLHKKLQKLIKKDLL